MLTSRPQDREPDVQGANMRIGTSKKKKPFGVPCVEYDLYFKREEVQEWVMPEDSTFNPPEWFQEGVDFVVWTENRGTHLKPDYDWVFVEKASSYYKSKQNDFTKKIKKKMVINQINDLKSNFNQLFDLIVKELNDE